MIHYSIFSSKNRPYHLLGPWNESPCTAFCGWISSARRRCFVPFLNQLLFIGDLTFVYTHVLVHYLHVWVWVKESKKGNETWENERCRGTEEAEMRRNGGRGQLLTWPPSSLHIYCLLSFFKGNLFWDISKTHLKAIFYSMASSLVFSLLPLHQFYPSSPVAPDVSQSRFLGCQHSFDSIPRAICNPLQGTEARSITHPTSLSHSLSAFLSSSLSGPYLFFPLPYQQPPNQQASHFRRKTAMRTRMRWCATLSFVIGHVSLNTAIIF